MIYLMAIDNKTLIPVVNKRKNPYTATLRNGEYYEWLPATEGYEDVVDLEFKDVQYLHTTSSTFREGYLFIDNDEARKRLGLEKDEVKVNVLSREEIEDMLKAPMNKFKKLGTITNKSLLQEVVEIAKEIGIDNVNKLQYLAEISGIPFEIIIDKDNDKE